jgi:DtxR family Mn-dependent transcriptional regulator
MPCRRQLYACRVSSGRGHSPDTYLETIYALAFPVGAYRPADAAKPIAARVAEVLGVSRAAAGETIKRLEDDGLIERMPNRWIALTDEGLARAERAVRRRRIAECFLTDFLEYPAQEVHALAERLGDSFDDELVERLHERLGRPERCPHGWPVAPAAEQAENGALAPLTAVAAGEGCEIVRLAQHDGELLGWLLDEGYEPGTQVEVVEVQPAAGQLRVRVGGQRRARTIAEKAARNLLVRRVEGTRSRRADAA